MLRHIKPGMLVFSVLYILLGLLLLLAPQAVADVFCIALDCAGLVGGFVRAAKPVRLF